MESGRDPIPTFSMNVFHISESREGTGKLSTNNCERIQKGKIRPNTLSRKIPTSASPDVFRDLPAC